MKESASIIWCIRQLILFSMKLLAKDIRLRNILMLQHHLLVEQHPILLVFSLLKQLVQAHEEFLELYTLVLEEHIANNREKNEIIICSNRKTLMSLSNIHILCLVHVHQLVQHTLDHNQLNSICYRLDNQHQYNIQYRIVYYLVVLDNHQVYLLGAKNKKRRKKKLFSNQLNLLFKCKRIRFVFVFSNCSNILLRQTGANVDPS